MPKFLSSIDLNSNQLLNALLHLVAGDVGSPTNGQVWIDTTNHVLKARINGVTISLGRLDQISAPTASVGLNSQRLVSVGDPSAAQDAVTLSYLQSYTAGARDYKDNVRAVLTSNTTLAGGAPNTVDGVTLAANDRVLVTGQTTGSQNGIYIVQTLGTGANGTWVRANDADTSGEVNAGMAVIATEGTTHADSLWFLTTNDPITLGTTALVFAKFTGSGGSGDVNRFAATGPGSTGTTWAVSHNLGSQDVTWSLRQVSDNAFVQADAVATDANTLTFTFGASVTLNTLRVVVHE